MADHVHKTTESQPANLDARLAELYRTWRRLNAERFDGSLIEPEIKFRRMAKSRGFFKPSPQPGVIQIDAQLALVDWPAVLDTLTACVEQQAQVARGYKLVPPRQVRRLLAKQAETAAQTQPVRPVRSHTTAADTTGVTVLVQLTRHQVDELARMARAAKGEPITVQLHAVAGEVGSARGKAKRPRRGV